MMWTRVMRPLAMVLALAACAPKASDPAEVASRTAKLYYDALLEGNYDVLRESHQGIASFEVARVEYDGKGHAANVFLNVHFADSTKEQIVVPMVERDDLWLMR